MIELLRSLCADKGISGEESGMLDVVREAVGDFAQVTGDSLGNIIFSLGEKSSQKHIMFDAHIDRIGLVVTYIDENGFLSASPVGGIDLRTLPGAAVRVMGRRTITGVVCTLPPHLLKEDKELSPDKIRIDTGLSAEEVKQTVRPGDSVILCSGFCELLNGCAAASGIDNRAGCAVLLRAAQLLKDRRLNCRVSFVLTAQEETGESGAATAAFSLMPDEAVVVDAGFARQEGVPAEKSGALGCGGIISISPVLSGAVTEKLKSLASRLEMEFGYEVCGGSTGTNADKISVAGKGVKTGVISLPVKNMHTPAEIVCLEDMERLADLLVLYAEEGGA